MSGVTAAAQASFALRGRNPDVLTCIANLSNDEVFTPPEFANRMLDTLAGSLGRGAWRSQHLGGQDDQVSRSLYQVRRVLREITSRLNKGLEKEIPDLQERIDHILTKQVFGIAITHLTSLLARRSVYCSKHANGKHSIAKGFVPVNQAISGSNGRSTFGMARNAVIAARLKLRSIASKVSKTTPMRSFTPRTSTLGLPRYSETSCNST